MMKWDLLLEWMTHVASGSWANFRRAAAELAAGNEDLDEQALCRGLRVGLSDLGHVRFFIDGSPRWNVLRPALVGVAAPNEHVFVGGRTRGIVDRLAAIAESNGAVVTTTESIPGLSRIRVVGDRSAVRASADALAIEYVPNGAAALAARVRPLRHVMDAAENAAEPINWAVRSWSFELADWVPERLERTAREYSNRHGTRRYFVHVGQARMFEIPKRESIYCAALARGDRIVQYSSKSRCLQVPRWAPLPEDYARAACLAAGRLGAFSDAWLVFQEVDPTVAAMLLVGLGQGFRVPEASA